MMMPPGAGQRLVQTVVQQDAVWQPCQGIMVSQTVDFLLRGHPLGDVFHQGQDCNLAAIL